MGCGHASLLASFWNPHFGTLEVAATSYPIRHAAQRTRAAKLPVLGWWMGAVVRLYRGDASAMSAPRERTAAAPPARSCWTASRRTAARCPRPSTAGPWPTAGVAPSASSPGAGARGRFERPLCGRLTRMVWAMPRRGRPAGDGTCVCTPAVASSSGVYRAAAQRPRRARLSDANLKSTRLVRN